MSDGNGVMLRIDGVSKNFGAVQALDRVGFEVPRGSVFGLIGPNGSGKTTLFNAITGIGPTSEGRIRYRDHDITDLKPHEIAKLGIARTFQNLKLFARMTVFDNVLGAQTSLPEVRFWQHIVPSRTAEAERTGRVMALLEMVGLAHRRNDLAQELPLGDQRRLELARALAREPELLLLDEPAGGMTPQETDGMVRLIERVAGTGPTVILIEHKMGMVMRLCRRIAVLNFGHRIAEGGPKEIQSDPVVREAYLGQEAVHA